jgi:PAS domain-containing protein
MKTRNTLAEQFAALSASAYDGVLVYDAGVVVDATPGAAALFGRTTRELDQCPAADLFTSESRRVLEQHLGSAVRGACLAMALHSDGTHVPIEAIVQAHLTLNGRRVQVVALRGAVCDEAVAPHSRAR